MAQSRAKKTPGITKVLHKKFWSTGMRTNNVINQCDQDYYLKTLKIKFENIKMLLLTGSSPVFNIHSSLYTRCTPQAVKTYFNFPPSYVLKEHLMTCLMLVITYLLLPLVIKYFLCLVNQ